VTSPLLAQAVAVVVWATTFVVSADALGSTSPAVLTLLRFLIAAGLLLPFAMRRGGMLRALQSRTTALLGFTGVAAYYGLQNLGLLYTTAGTAALLQAALPVATAALGVVVLRERLSGRAIAGLILATAGVALVGSAAPELGLGAVLVVTGVVAYAVYTVVLRRLGDRAEEEGDRTDPGTREPVVLATATALWGVAFLLPWQAWELLSGTASLPSGTSAVLATAYLGLVASGATLLLWTYGATRLPANVSGVLTAAIPALGYAMAVAAGESASAIKTVGGILAVSGAVLATHAAVLDPRVSPRV
jgi:drug/metabolite transporter (DMT)-like permease